MKKTLTTFAIILTLCLATSAFAAPPKKASDPWKPMTYEEALKDKMSHKYGEMTATCMEDLAENEAFNHATSTAYVKAVRASAEKCRTYQRFWVLRICELTVDPQKGASPGSLCAGGRYLEEHISNMLDNFTLLSVKHFDEARAKKGLPPRPSFDK